MKTGVALGLGLTGLVLLVAIGGGVAMVATSTRVGDNMAGRLAAHHGIPVGLATGIVDVARDVGTRPEWLAALIDFETGGTFSPIARNPVGSATGLIQFTGTTAARIGTSLEELVNMTADGQLYYVKKYLERVKGGTWPDDPRPADLGTLKKLAFSVFWLPGRFLPMTTELPENLRAGNVIVEIGEYVAHIRDRMLPEVP